MTDTKRQASGRFLLRIDPGLHDVLRRAAAAAGTSLNEYCARKLAAPVGDLSSYAGAAEVVARAAHLFADALIGVVVFGSWVRGEATAESDVDVLVVVEDRVALRRDLYRRWDEAPLRWQGHAVEPHFVHLPPPGETVAGLWAEVALDGVVLFARDHTLAARLARVRRDILEDRLQPRGLRGHAARDYVRRATVRLETLEIFLAAESWADAVRESQEVVELTLKALLRSCGVDPPRIHDVSDVLLAERARLPDALAADVEELAEISRQLRRDRELAFYGAEDLTPTDFYSRHDATRALGYARRAVEAVRPHVLGAES